MEHARPDQTALGKALAHALHTFGSARFVPALAALLGALERADDVMIVLYRDGEAPELVHDQGTGS